VAWRIASRFRCHRQRVYVAALPANWRELARFQAQRDRGFST
jgi:hypothetical protein